MKNLIYPFILLLGLALITSCSKTRLVSMDSMRPAAINVPSHIKTILIVDRTKFKKKGVNIVEGLLTGELPGQDRAATQASIYAFQQELNRSPRFQHKVATEILEGNSITGALPKPIQWWKIDDLNRKYETDAVLAIELFDSDFVVTQGKRKVKRKVKQGDSYREVEVTEFYANGVCNLQIGYRIYDGNKRTVVDQHQFQHSKSWEAVGDNARDALGLLVSNAQATKFVGELAGADYAHKIAPMPIRISRQFYSKSKKENAIPTGARFADVNNWEAAADTWKKAIAGAEEKEAGQLTYNMAIASEVLGNLDLARQWAQKAYTQYGNKKARDYLRVLDRRIANENLVRQQMEGG